MPQTSSLLLDLTLSIKKLKSIENRPRRQMLAESEYKCLEFMLKFLNLLDSQCKNPQTLCNYYAKINDINNC